MIRASLVLAPVLALLFVGCGPGAAAPPPEPPAVALHLSPACDLVPAAGLTWLVEAEPRAIAQASDLILAISTVIPEARFRSFAASHGGIDPRQIEELCIGAYGDATLTIARTPFDPARVHAAFEERSTRPALRVNVTPRPPVVRATGDEGGRPERLLTFGREALALEHGKPGPLRAAEAFAFGKLRRASPALRGAALARAAEVLGDAPLRAFTPGPFEGETAKGFGGLLRASTAAGLSATPVPGAPRLVVRLVLTGAWGQDAPAAGERLAAAIHVLAESGVGKLLGLDHPLEGPTLKSAAPEALVVEAVYDANALARGLHDALDADVSEIMR